jgi:hypothetical protein
MRYSHIYCDCGNLEGAAMTTILAARDDRGRFQPGHSGNPAGKKPGTLNHATQLKRLLEGEEYDRVARKAIEAACEGHMPSVRFLMERLVPRPRGRAIALDLPPGATRAERLTALVDQMCAGEISAEEAKAMIAVIDEADRAARQPARREAAAGAAPVTREPAPAETDAAVPSVLQTACIPDLAKPPGLRARLLQSTCISARPDVTALDPLALKAAAVVAVARARAATPSARRAAA